MNLENDESAATARQSPLTSPDASASTLPSYPSEDLFRGHRELLIQHQSETYRLRVTRTNKLILTK